MREINEAYEILSDAIKRKQYDDARQDTQSGGSAYYEEDDDNGSASSYADPNIDEHWKRIIDYYPDLEKHRKDLNLLSQDLAFTYKAYMVTEKKFESEQNIHIALEANFLRKYFGSHKEIQEFGKSLLLNRKRNVAQALNKDVAFFGNDIRPIEFLTKFKKKSGLFDWDNIKEKQNHGSQRTQENRKTNAKWTSYKVPEGAEDKALSFQFFRIFLIIILCLVFLLFLHS